MSTFEAIAIFVLAAIPGVVALEVIQWGRRPLRRRDAGATLAFYTLLSGGAILIARTLWDADDRIVELVQLNEAQAGRVVEVFLPLAGSVLASGVILGFVIRLILPLKDAIAHRMYDQLTRGDGPFGPLRRMCALLLASGLLPQQSWDLMLARAGRRGVSQLVRIRLRDGSVVHGTFAADGRADFDAGGRGLLLDHELVESGGELVEIGSDSGIYIHPDAVATVSFVDRPRSGVS